MTGPMVLADGTEIPPTSKSFEVDFCTVARWDNGKIVEENLFCGPGRDDVPARPPLLIADLLSVEVGMYVASRTSLTFGRLGRPRW
jgi:hypothetical protein